MPFSQRIYDTGLGAFVYYTKQDITATPTVTETTPNHTNNLDANTHTVLSEVPMLEVNSLSDLRNVPLSISGQASVRVRNYAVDGDGGGGIFHWLLYETTDDDDGIYILPTGHGGTGRWVRDGYLGEEYNALWWGMASVADGDSTATFQQAIDSSLGKILRVPKNPLSTYPGGRYRVGGLTPKSNMHVKLDPDVLMFANFSGGTYQPCWVIDNDNPLTEFSIEGGTWQRFKPFFRQDEPVNKPAVSHGSFRHMEIQGSATDENGFEIALYVDFFFEHVFFNQLNHAVFFKSVDPFVPRIDSTATGGTTTTIVDTSLTEVVDVFYNDFQVVLRPFTATAEISRVTDYDPITKTITVSPAFASAPIAADEYRLFDPNYELIALVDSGASTTTVIALDGVDLTDDQYNGSNLVIQDSSSVRYIDNDITDTDGTAETLTIAAPLAGAPSVGSYAMVEPVQYAGHQNVTNFHHCRWIACRGYGIYKLDNARDAANLMVYSCSAERQEGAWLKVGGTMQCLVIEGMYVEFNGLVIDEPDIIIDASDYFIRNCTLRNLYFSVQGSSQTEKLHLIGRVNPIVSDCMFNLGQTGPPTAAIYLNLIQSAQVVGGAQLINNYILDALTPGETYRDRLYRLEPGTNEAAIVVQECTMSNQDLMPGLEISLGTVTANDVNVQLYKAVTADYASPETINTFSAGVLGQVLHIRFTTANTTIAHEAGGAGQIHLKGGVDLTPAVDSIMTLYHNGTDWYEEISPVRVPTTVDTIADLRAITSDPVFIDKVFVRYHTTFDGGGGGTFVWDAVSLEVDNNGTVILPSGHVGSGRWVRSEAYGVFNVRWFGAVGDGVTDDQPGIQAAIDAAIAYPHGTVVFPDTATYRIDAQLYLGSLVGVINIEGQGQHGATGSKKGTEIVSHVDDDAILSESLSRITISNILITDGLGVSRTTGAGVRSVRSGNTLVTLRNVRVMDHYYGFHITRGVLCQFEQCTAEASTSHGFYLDQGVSGSSTSANLSGCFSTGNGGAGYYFDGGAYYAVVACASDGNLDGYIIAKDGSTNPNTIAYMGCGAEGNTNRGFGVNSSAGSSMTGLTYSTCQAFNSAIGFSPDAAQGVTIMGCKTVSSSTYGIDLTNAGLGQVNIIGHIYSSDATNLNDPNDRRLEIDSAQGMIPSTVIRERAVTTLPTGSSPNISADRRGVYTTNNVSATNISSVAGGLEGERLTLLGDDGGNSTIIGGAGMVLNGGRFVLEDEYMIQFLFTGGKWIETARSPNFAPDRISPAALTADVDDWDVGGLLNNQTTAVTLTTDGGSYTISGLSQSVGILDGSEILFVNATNATITLTHNDTNSSAINRFDIQGTVSYVLGYRESVRVILDASLNRWRVVDDPLDNPAHSTTHLLGGGDEIDGDKLDIDFTPANYTPTTAPAEATSVDHLAAHLAGIDGALATTAAHSTDHITGGTDEIDGDQLDIDFTPTNYTPSTAPAEATNVDHLTAHLAGIDSLLASLPVTATLTTVNSTPTPIYTFATVTDQCLVIEGLVQGIDAVSGNVAYYKAIALFENIGGTVAQKDVFEIVEFDDVNLWGYDFNINGTDVEFRVIGDVADTVEWKFTGTFSSHG